jgi:hypothetical protein
MADAWVWLVSGAVSVAKTVMLQLVYNMMCLEKTPLSEEACQVLMKLCDKMTLGTVLIVQLPWRLC